MLKIINSYTVKLPNGEIILIEMQNTSSDALYKRFEYYMSLKLVNQIKRAGEYVNIKKVYGIFFINSNDSMYKNMFTKCVGRDIINDIELPSLKTKYIFNLKK